jgi:PAS domain S-box-containing protein
MLQRLQVLIVEDDAGDAELILAELRNAGFDPEWHRVETEAGYVEKLYPGLDVILSDYSMPKFNGLRALALLNERGLEIPFIIVSGIIGEETAISAIKEGAVDYLLKDRLARLGPAVRQALDQYRLRRERERAEVKFRKLVEQSLTGIYLAQNDRFVYVNPRMADILGFSEAELMGPSLFEFIVPADREMVRENIRRRLEGEVESVQYEFRMLRKDGTVINAEVRGCLSEHDGQPAILGSLLDVTEQRRAQETAREQAEMLDRAHEAIVVYGIHTRRITFWNRGAVRLYGWTADEAVGRDVGELIFSDASAPDAVTAHLLKAGEWRGEHNQVSKTGKKSIVSSSASLVNDANGEPKLALVINIDITEQKEFEARFLRAQRMESIGTLASGVAHDLNNILTPIMMSAPLLRRDLAQEKREHIISSIETCAGRGAQIIKQVLTFGRGLEGDKRPVQAGALVKEVIKIMRETFPKSIGIESSLAPTLWPIIGDSTQIHQVLLNLCVNARDAMPGGGKVRLSAANLEVDANYASMLPEANPGPYVLLEVSDSGTGIAPEIVERIFDPFFTTKEVGKGTGLGLSTVHGIVKGHGGFLKVTSSPGKGTTFQVYLPAAPDQDAAIDTSESETQIPNGHGELVLVVDDEETVRRSASMVLEASGYEVVLAADGTEALAVFAQNSDRIAIVLTDLMMPFLDGVGLIRALHSMSPNVPIIASTGLEEKHKLLELRAMDVETVLYKPYGAKALLRTVHRSLHPPPPGA